LSPAEKRFLYVQSIPVNCSSKPLIVLRLIHHIFCALPASGKINPGSRSMMKKQAVIQLIRQHERELSDRYGVKSLALFGSVVRDEANPASDIDLLVEFDRPVGLFGLFALQDRLEEIFGCKVDLGTPDSLKPRLRASVISEMEYVS
jgi:uncharacterized protein